MGTLKTLLLNELGVTPESLASQRSSNISSSQSQARTTVIHELEAGLNECDVSLAALQAEHDVITRRLAEVAQEMEAIRSRRQELADALSSQRVISQEGEREEALNPADIEKSVQKLLHSIVALQQASQETDTRGDMQSDRNLLLVRFKPYYLIDIEESARLSLELYLLAESKCLRFLIKRILSNKNKISLALNEIDQYKRLKLPIYDLEKAIAQHSIEVNEDTAAVVSLETSLIEMLGQFNAGLKSGESSH